MRQRLRAAGCPQQTRAATAWCALGLACLLLALLPQRAAALQPAFIKGSVYSAYDNALLYTAVIETTNGLSTKTSSGSFSFRVPPNVYSFIISAPGYTTNMLTGILASPGQTATVNIWLVPSSTTTGFLEGRIVDAASFKPVTGAFIAVDLGGAGVSDDNGFFRMTVPSGTAAITAAAPSYASKTVQNISLRPERTERIVLYLKKKRSRSVTITGLVKNTCSGEKLSNAQILTMTGDFAVTSNGAYSLDIESGPSTIIAAAQGYQYAYRSGPFSNYFFPSILNINLLPSIKSFGLLLGTIRNALDRSPVPDARIVSNTDAISFSGPDGSFRLYTSSCTSYITVTAPGFDRKQFPVAVTPGSFATVTVPLEPLSTSAATAGAADNRRPVPLFVFPNGIAAYTGPVFARHSERLQTHSAELAALIAADAALRESFLEHCTRAAMLARAPSLEDINGLHGYAPADTCRLLEQALAAGLSDSLRDAIGGLLADLQDGSLFEDLYLIQK